MTEAGREAVALADERAVAIEHRISQALTAEERDTLRSLLARCSEAIQQE